MFYVVLILLTKKNPLIVKYVAVLLLKLHFLLWMVTLKSSLVVLYHKSSFEIFLGHHTCTLNSQDVPVSTINKGLELDYSLLVCFKVLQPQRRTD